MDSNKKIKMIAFAGSVILDLLILDLFTKYAVKNGLIAKIDLLPRFFAITHHENHGLIGNFPLPYWAIIVLVLVALVFLFLGMRQAVQEERYLELFALAVVAGGALGNFVDRLVNGYVFDWLMFFNTSIINIADIFITLGIMVYAWSRFKMSQESSLSE
ncbi:signal peptidase II [Patescibacteria group bacterium]|nr:signal peptidase II [Patescibacteria group bacterium]